MIGIDLGTTNSLITYVEDGEIIIIKNALGENLTPSVVACDQGEIFVGQIAVEKGLKNPKCAVKEFKRFMGSKKVYEIEDYEFTPIELSSYIIRYLVNCAEHQLKMPIKEAIISVPAYFNDLQRKATIEAAEVVGLKVNMLISEPTAAALAYNYHLDMDEKNVVVVDLGGGTFDVSVLEVFDALVEVQAVSGNNYFGGLDFDKAILDHILLDESFDLPLHLNELALSQAELLKKELSINHEAVYIVKYQDYLYERKMNSSELDFILDKFTTDLIKPIKNALYDADLSFDEIDEVVLVGGSTKVPWVRKKIAEIFKKEVKCEINPDEVVAIGSGIRAGIASKNEAFSDVIMTDVCPYTLGTATNKLFSNNKSRTSYDPIIERNMPIPISILKHYTNMRDNQDKVSIPVYQGDSFKYEDNLLLGTVDIPLPLGPKNSILIEVRFTYDVSGILEVVVHIPSTGETEKKILINNQNLSKEEIEEKLTKIKHLKVHPREQEKNAYVIATLEKYYSFFLGDIRNQIERELNEFLLTLDAQNPIDIGNHRVRLLSFIEHIGENLYFN